MKDEIMLSDDFEYMEYSKGAERGKGIMLVYKLYNEEEGNK
jgi:hypothetical protein